ncbi:Uncharacterized protein FWK35_00016920 [Aphis craccivora]|uniref:Transmembrane protein n=1 Tax=Aphis craccivora TaxID=307492 RepID=A0A6G0Z294_APHCR|nr:Uncharacterized protein FWK35_00016920 [Aphis craccivora]
MFSCSQNFLFIVQVFVHLIFLYDVEENRIEPLTLIPAQKYTHYKAWIETRNNKQKYWRPLLKQNTRYCLPKIITSLGTCARLNVEKSVSFLVVIFISLQYESFQYGMNVMNSQFFRPYYNNYNSRYTQTMYMYPQTNTVYRNFLPDNRSYIISKKRLIEFVLFKAINVQQMPIQQNDILTRMKLIMAQLKNIQNQSADKSSKREYNPNAETYKGKLIRKTSASFRSASVLLNYIYCILNKGFSFSRFDCNNSINKIMFIILIFIRINYSMNKIIYKNKSKDKKIVYLFII